MKITYLSATDMGPDQQEIADKVFDFVQHLSFKSKNDFFEMEGCLINNACVDLGWHSVPQVGGLLAEWSDE